MESDIYIWYFLFRLTIIQEKSVDNYGRPGLVCDPGQGGGPPPVSPARITSALRRRIWFHAKTAGFSPWSKILFSAKSSCENPAFCFQKPGFCLQKIFNIQTVITPIAIRIGHLELLNPFESNFPFIEKRWIGIRHHGIECLVIYQYLFAARCNRQKYRVDGKRHLVT